MEILEYAKSKEKLLNAPPVIQCAMKDYVDYFRAEEKLRIDIADRFNYPSLWAAIDRLLGHRENKIIAYMQIANNGYTSDDAIMFCEHESEDE